MAAARHRLKYLHGPHHYEPGRVSIWSTFVNGHRHRLIFDGDGNGWTDEAAGHRHKIRELELEVVGGHAHDLTARRAEEVEDDGAA